MKLVLLPILAVTLHAQTLIAHIGAGTGTNGGTTTGITTSTANFIVVLTSSFSTGTGLTVTDNMSNGTATALTTYTNSGNESVTLWYWQNPTVGAGHTFTCGGTNVFCSIYVEAWSGMATSGVFDAGTDSGANAAAITIQPGSITPPSGAQLVIAGLGTDRAAASPVSINSSFNISDQVTFSGGTFFGGGMASLVQTPNGSAINPTWTVSGTAANLATNIAAFKVATGGTTPAGLKQKKLLKLDASNMPSFCAGMTTPDCDGFSSIGEVSFACLYKDGSCGAATVPINPLAGVFAPSFPSTVIGAVTMGQHTCVFGSNLGTSGVVMGVLGVVNPQSVAYSCTQ